MNKTAFSDVKLYLDPAAAGRTISPMLFGYNVEITRLGVWRGLSTEMVNNRKFAVADENGKALRWIVCGDPGNVSVDPAFGYAGKRSLRISGKDCGVCQVSEALAFAAGRTYALRLVVYSEEPVPVTVKIGSVDGRTELFCGTWEAVPCQWTTFTAEFTANAYCENGQIAKAIYGDKVEEFMWDGLALIWRSGVTYINEPYVTGGKAINMTAFGESADSNAMYTGKPYIGELGYAFLFRNYRSDYGKWQTTDPLGYPDGWNNLAYCNNEVVKSI